MATTDIVQRVSDAITAILDADAGIRAITKRNAKNCVPFRTGDTGTQLPVLLLAFVVMPEIGATGNDYRPTYQLTAVAEGNAADRTANALIERAVAVITQPALTAQGIDGYPERRTRRRLPPDDTPGALGRADLDLTLVVTKD